MRKHHPDNERVKREYLTYLQAAKRMSTSTVDQIASSISLFEESTGYKDFRKFHRSQALAFKDRLQAAINEKTGKPLAKATIHSRLMAMKAFVIWLQGRSGFKSRINYGDGEYFNPTANDERIAKAARQRPAPTLEQLRHAFEVMPSSILIERRDRALFAFAILSGARDDALASFAIGHVDLQRREVFQDAREVRTKNRKTFTSQFFPVDEIYGDVFAAWIAELRASGSGPEDPLFPATAIVVGPDNHFVASGLTREFWKTANAIRRIFNEAFARAGLPYFNPHSIRSTLAIHGEKHANNAEEWKAYSQNFGHSSPMTTYTGYGTVAPHRQAEIMGEMAKRVLEQPKEQVHDLDEDTVRQLLKLAKALEKS